MPFEHLHGPLLPRVTFLRRLARNVLLGVVLVAASLGIGMVGYHLIADLGWVDSFLNASMILTGMGPIDPMRTTGAKLFAGLYALFSGVAFLSVMAIVLAPVAHRIMHRFHMETEEDEEKADPGAPGEAGQTS